jgi:hypothetical protein
MMGNRSKRNFIARFVRDLQWKFQATLPGGAES